MRDADLRVAEDADIAISLTEPTVSPDEEALELRFPGSWTVRVRGRDLRAEVDELRDFGLG